MKDEEFGTTTRVGYVMALASLEAASMGAPNIQPEHVLYGILLLHESVAMRLLTSSGVDRTQLRNKIKIDLARSLLEGNRNSKRSGVTEAALQFDLRQPLADARTYMKPEHGRALGTEHLLLMVLGSGGSASRLLSEMGVTVESITQKMDRIHKTGVLDP